MLIRKVIITTFLGIFGLGFTCFNCQSVIKANSSPTFNPSSLNIVMHVNQKKEEKILLTNDSQNLVHFSLYKSSDRNDISNYATKTEQSDIEVGSSWLTYKCNYQRQSCNPIESSIPPYSFKWRYQGNKPLLSPVVSGDSLIIPSEDGNIYIIDSRTGIYRTRISLDYPILNIHLAGNYLIILTTEEIISYNRGSQVFLWRKPLEENSLANVAILEETIFFLDGTYLISANISTGNELWKIADRNQNLLLANDMVLSSSQTNINAYEMNTGKVEWRIDKVHLLDMPAYLNEQLFCILLYHEKAYLHCYSISGNLNWKQEIPFTDANFIAVESNSVIVSSITGYVIHFNRVNGQQKWIFKNQEKIHITPVIAYGHVYIGDNNGNLMAIHLEDGYVTWQTNTGFPLYNPFVIARGFIYFTDAVQTLYAYGREWENVIPPEPPDQVKAIAGDKMVTLFWRHAKQTPDFAGYHIYRKLSGEREFSIIASIGVINQYQDKALKNKQTYHYVIRSFDTYSNESTNSNMVSVTPTETNDPDWFQYDPTGGIIHPASSVTIQLQFISSGILPGEYTGFLQCLYTDNSLRSDLITLPIVLRVLKENEEWLPLPKITSLEASDTRVMLKWESVASAKEYLLYRSTVRNDELKLIQTLPAGRLSYQDDQVSNHKTYYYYLQYNTEKGTRSDYSLEASVIPKPLPIEILYPSSPTVYEPVFTITGQADPKSRVFFRNMPVGIDPSGTFQMTVGVNVGWNTLVFYAVDTDKKTQEVSLEVQFVTSMLTIELSIGSSVVVINGKTWPYRLDAPPQIVKNRTFVPLRFISETTGATIEWSPVEQRIDIIKGNQHIALWIGKTRALLNNRIIELESAPFLFNNRTMVPLRFITEPLGAQLHWDPVKQSIVLVFKA